MSGRQAETALPAFLTEVVAPFLTAYVAWVLAEARRVGIGRLYFVARDGQIMFSLAQQLCSGTQAPELRYLYGSRRAWLLPSITDTDPTWRRLVVTPAQVNRLVDICGRLGIAGADVNRIASVVGLSSAEVGLPLTQKGANEVLDRLFQDIGVRSLLVDRILASRELAKAYFEQEGLFDGTNWALVDAGWSLNCQAALKRILIESGRADLEPRGFYIGLARDHLSRHVAGLAISMMPGAGSIFARRRVVLEHCFTPATHASTLGYQLRERRIGPMLSPETRSHAEIKFARNLQQGVLSYAARMLEAGGLQQDFDTFREAAVRAAAAFIAEPRRSDIAAVQPLKAIADLRHEDAYSRPLCRPLSWSDLAEVGLATVSPQRAFRQSVALWLEGSAALSTPAVRLLLRTMLAVDGLRNRLKGR